MSPSRHCLDLTSCTFYAYNISMNKTIKQAELKEAEFYQIISDGIPSCKQILKDLRNFPAVLYDAFDDSYSTTTEFVKSKITNPKTGRNFIPQAMRFLVHNYLSQKHIRSRLVDENDIEENEDIIWDKKVLVNNGIAGNIFGYDYRVFKAIKSNDIKNKLPPPVTAPKRKYYNQEHLKAYQLQLMNFKDKAHAIHFRPHLVFLWDIDKKHFINLYLSVPKYANEYSFGQYYTELIPHPATVITGTDDANMNDLQLKLEKDSGVLQL